jgi:hypothetical protein
MVRKPKTPLDEDKSYWSRAAPRAGQIALVRSRPKNEDVPSALPQGAAAGSRSKKDRSFRGRGHREVAGLTSARNGGPNSGIRPVVACIFRV